MNQIRTATILHNIPGVTEDRVTIVGALRNVPHGFRLVNDTPVSRAGRYFIENVIAQVYLVCLGVLALTITLRIKPDGSWKDLETNLTHSGFWLTLVLLLLGFLFGSLVVLSLATAANAGWQRLSLRDEAKRSPFGRSAKVDTVTIAIREIRENLRRNMSRGKSDV